MVAVMMSKHFRFEMPLEVLVTRMSVFMFVLTHTKPEKTMM